MKVTLMRKVTELCVYLQLVVDVGGPVADWVNWDGEDLDWFLLRKTESYRHTVDMDNYDDKCEIIICFLCKV